MSVQAILIAGPTASGKSALALALAESLDGTIVNADSMQVYAEMRVLTARPSMEEEARAPHVLYGHVPAQEAYSAGRFVAEAADAIAAIRAAGRLPIVVGGTGLYFKALTEGLSPMPAIPAQVRAYWRERGAEDGAAALHSLLAARDPEMAARLHPTDTQRLVRALEVLDASGRSLADWQRQPGVPVIAVPDALALVVMPERDQLFRRCDARFDLMVAGGALEEAAGMAALELDPALPAMRALGLPPLMAHIGGKATLEDAVRQGKAETRQYAKRQVTWLKRHMIAWNIEWLNNLECSIRRIIANIKQER